LITVYALTALRLLHRATASWDPAVGDVAATACGERLAGRGLELHLGADAAGVRGRLVAGAGVCAACALEPARAIVDAK
jgi:hypothetical protein